MFFFSFCRRIGPWLYLSHSRLGFGHVLPFLLSTDGLPRPSHIASTAAVYTFTPKDIRTSLLPFWPESGHKTSIYHSIITCSTPIIRGTCYKNTDGVLLIILVVDKCMFMMTWKGWSKRTILKCLQSFQLEHGSTGRELSLILPHFFHHPLPSFLTLGAAQACVCSAHT